MLTIYSAKQKNLSAKEFTTLYNIIVKAYAVTESEMWGENYVRVSEKSFKEFIEKDEVLVAFLNNEVVGGLRFYEAEKGVFSFGLFGADFSKSRMGIGKILIERVEEEAKKKGAKKIKIEILRPQKFEIPIKVILADWYQRLGYVYSHSVDFEKVFPEKAKGILAPCNFDYYVKDL